jgi:multidrug resistance efflux pump
VLIGVLSVGLVERAFSSEPQGGAEIPPQNNQPARPDGKTAGTLQFMALIDAGERRLITLLPGETVGTVFCKQGDLIRQGQPVVRLNNDTIANGIADLILKKNKIKEEIQQLKMAELEKQQKEKQLQRIEKEMEAEKSLKNQIAGYTSPVLKQLETQHLALSEQIEISSAHVSALRENNADNEQMFKFIQDQMNDLDLRRQNLLIKAPFDARVFYLNPDLERVPPGTMVCELRNETFFLARGKIIQHQRKLLHVGDKVKVTPDLSDDAAVEGTVQSIEYMQEQKEIQSYPSFEVIVRIAAQEKWLRPGMMVSIDGQASPVRN